MTVCVVCNFTQWFITTNTMIGFMRSYLLAKGIRRWYMFHSYVMFYFHTTLVISHIYCFVLVCSRNPDNVPCCGTIFTPECPLRWCFRPAITFECGVFEPPLSCWPDWVNNRDAGDLRHKRDYYDVTVVCTCFPIDFALEATLDVDSCFHF